MMAQRGDLKWKEGKTSSRICYYVIGKKHIAFDYTWQSLEVFSLFVVYSVHRVNISNRKMFHILLGSLF